MKKYKKNRVIFEEKVFDKKENLFMEQENYPLDLFLACLDL
ncbi:hypothetical protein ANHYDRO_01722 [Anaerococcus hydrogenalis DSM 7454]|uniref:Uncharacterized protein n=1 Tax=Anaerococcus hydrogenalis DSM 7454 TaxID=561177 RepID=B6WAK6_9FIRM|nr:hypothetical protein ANHYDRO_01722 [Anaerococcus hydrogenalis DSM 7454]